MASKIVATLGPACHDVDTLAELLNAGMTVARIDLTWGTLDYHMQALANLNEAMRRARRMCAVMVRVVRLPLAVFFCVAVLATCTCAGDALMPCPCSAAPACCPALPGRHPGP